MSQLAVNIMERQATENPKALRREGMVPGIIYGESLDTAVPVKVENTNLLRLLKNNSKGSILKLNLNNKVWSCVVKEVQKDTIADEVLHVDFQYVKSDEIIKMNIPITYTGRENLELNRLVLGTFQPELELQGPAEKIPEHFDVDVSKMQFEDKLYAKDIELPEDIKLLTDPETLLAVVNASVTFKDIQEDSSESSVATEEA